MENEPTTPTPDSPQATTGTTSGTIDNTNTMGMLCHLLALTGLIGVPFGHILGPLIMWLVKKDECPYVDECGKEALNFNISITIYFAAIILVTLPITIIPLIGILFAVLAMVCIFALCVASLTLIVIASIKANEGTNYKYPFTIRFIK